MPARWQIGEGVSSPHHQGKGCELFSLEKKGKKKKRKKDQGKTNPVNRGGKKSQHSMWKLIREKRRKKGYNRIQEAPVGERSLLKRREKEIQKKKRPSLLENFV